MVFLQNHDQVGNRASGERLNVLLGSEAKQRLAASLLLLSPYLPLLFMGEEYGEENPFPFFCSFQAPELIEAVRKGRKQQFADPRERGEVPDPASEATFASARLSWSWPEGTFRAGLRRLYRDLLELRRAVAGPARLREPIGAASPGDGPGPLSLELVRGQPYRQRRHSMPSSTWATRPVPMPQLESCSADAGRVQLGIAAYAADGERGEDSVAAALLPWECVVLEL